MATKQQIASTARGLFAAHGYVGTTITAIAAAADIPAPTIYSAFGTKASILQAIAWGVTSTLDVDQSHDAALAEPDPAQGLRLTANIQRRQYEHMYPHPPAAASRQLTTKASGNSQRTRRLGYPGRTPAHLVGRHHPFLPRMVCCVRLMRWPAVASRPLRAG